jgi:hypothetical protein
MHLARGYPPATPGKIVVWGRLASRPFGGMTWQVLHHLAGVRRLGFDVWYVEDSYTPVIHPSHTSDIEDIVVVCEALKTGYERHSRAARSIAEAYFSAEAVLARVMSVVGCS